MRGVGLGPRPSFGQMPVPGGEGTRRAPEFLATAFLFAVLGLLVHLLLGA